MKEVQTMRIGVMGVHYGHIGGMLSSALAAPDAELVGMVEAEDGLYARHSGNGAVKRYASLEDMLGEARPELVLEGVRHKDKAVLIETCAAAGAHMLLDKPLCYDMADWQRIKASVETHGTRLSMWFTSRRHPPFIALREAIQNGELGEIVSLISTHPHKLSRERGPAWYFDGAQYTGTFHDLAGHGVDQVRWLTAAEYTGVHALQTCKKFTDAPALIDHCQASFQLSTGALATLTADWLTPEPSPAFGDTRFVIMGTEGSAHLRAYAGDHLLVVSGRRGAHEPPLPENTGGSFVQDMIESLSRGEEPSVSTADVLAVARAGLRAQESAALGGEFLTL